MWEQPLMATPIFRDKHNVSQLQLDAGLFGKSGIGLSIQNYKCNPPTESRSIFGRSDTKMKIYVTFVCRLYFIVMRKKTSTNIASWSKLGLLFKLNINLASNFSILKPG